MITKREFIIQYILNRALAKDGDMLGDAVAAEALKAWNYIERNTKDEVSGKTRG